MFIEPLEDRSVPAVALVNGVLHITGAPGPDHIRLAVHAQAGYELQVYGARPNPLPLNLPQGGGAAHRR
jgi:hypothetical protein